MKLVINKDRSVISVGTWGTVNENDYEILDFEFPEELEEYNKRIVYYLGDERVWDTIVDNKAYITNAITTKGDVKAYVWCTKENTEREADTDFRTMLFEMHFYENENADGIVPTEEQVDGFNTMLTAMNAKIDEVDALEQTIETAEAQRQAAEATRVSNENTRESNESTRQTNEQTRQTQEAERERKTDEAIADIEDKTAEYNANAEAKTTAFNNNATQKTNEFNSNASSKTSAFNSNAETKTNAFNTNATNKTNAFNSNASEKTTAFDNNASTKTSEFNTNAESKTTDFNTNATSKTNDFNDNASAKTTAFNQNAQDKIDEYDEHIVEYQAQIDELQEEVEELSENMPWNTTEQATEISVDDAAKYSKNKLELFGNTSQDSTTGKNLWGGKTFTTSQFSVDFTINVDGTVSASGTASSNAVSGTITQYNNNQMYKTLSAGTYTVSKNSDKIQLQVYDTSSNVVKTLTTTQNSGNFTLSNTTDIIVRIMVPSGTSVNDTFKFQLELGSTATDWEKYTGGVPSPNPDYPQPIHVVTGENDIYWTSNENKLDLNKNYIKGGINSNTGAINTTANPTITLGNNSISVYTPSAWNGYISDYYDCQSKDIIQLNFVASTNYFWVAIAEYDLNKQYIKATPISNTSLREINIKTTNETKYLRLIFEGSRSGYSIDFTNINFVIQNHVILDLGSIELCKIGDYQDYLYKENGNWYIKKILSKYVFSGNENISKATDVFYTNDIANNILTSGIICLCNRMKAVVNTTIGSSVPVNCCCFRPGDYSRFYFNLSSITTDINEIKQYLSNNNTFVIYPLATPTTTQITDETLIAQLDAIYEHLQLVKGTNNITVTAEDLAPYMELSYMQDLKSKLDNLDSRLALLE